MASSSLTRLPSRSFRRILSFSIRSLHEGPDTIDELLERHLVKKYAGKSSSDVKEAELQSLRLRVMGTRREALSLYRDILRASRYFTWPDTRGVIWRDVLRENARKEFEAARFETDPEIVTKLLIGGCDAVVQVMDKLLEQSKKIAGKEEQERREGRR